MVTRRKDKNKPRKIYIDLGANCGNSYYRMKNSETQSSEETLSTDEWEAYLFECNPLLINHFLLDLVRNETTVDHRMVQLITSAASVTNGEITFYMTAGQDSIESMPNPKCESKSDYNPSGASTIYGNAQRAGTSITVQSLNFFEWHKSLNLQIGDVVHMKMDIEGAEVDVMNMFLDPSETTNQICYWELFWNEYHKNIFTKGSEDYIKHEEFENTFPQRFEEKCGRPLQPNVFG